MFNRTYDRRTYSVYSMFGLLQTSVDLKLLWVRSFSSTNMRTVIIKFYRVPHFNQSLDWYKIALFIQRGKSSTVYIIKTRDKKVFEALTSSCMQEVRNELCNIAKKLIGRSYLFEVTFSCLYSKMNSYQCQMRNYHKTCIL